MELISVSIDDKKLTSSDWSLTPNVEDTKMTINTVPDTKFTMKVVTKFKPADNLELSGLYKSSGTFCTQCEAEGFRLITYFPDRPDVMSIFTVTMTADKSKYPVLLSNGNLENTQTDLPDNKHSATWFDPHLKPCYLFALVAGDLSVVKDEFTTMTKKTVQLRIYAEHKNINRCDFAMESLKRAMRWDETRFGLEYDLDLFNIVAVDDFNMGAMENKSLNIFNSRLVLATPDSATDTSFGRIEGVIGHEYFHNWTGNRVTCRDWFQLSLKEGLTVFRDQEFSADISSRAVRRIGDVRFLRDSQFAEDASPMSHPIRPASYMKIDNFYTLTVYEKGAEVIRVYHSVLGETGFRAGMDLYFKRHDGNAVTCDDFFASMQDANPDVDITSLHNWYHQAGTPTVQCVRGFSDETKSSYKLSFTQVLPKTPDEHGHAEKIAQLVPVKVGLLNGVTGSDIDLAQMDITVTDEHGVQGKGSRVALDDTTGATTLVLSALSATFTFTAKSGSGDLFGNVTPVPSILRNFSAPVTMDLSPEFTTEEQLHILAHDSDPFNRWEAAQSMARGILGRCVRRAMGDFDETSQDQSAYDMTEYPYAATITGDSSWTQFVNACSSIIDDASNKKVDRAWVEEALSFPGVSSLVQELQPVNPIVVHQVCKAFTKAFATKCAVSLKKALTTCEKETAEETAPYDVSAEQTARRSFAAYALRTLASLDEDDGAKIDFDSAYLRKQFDDASNMTEVVASLGALSKAGEHGESSRQYAFESFLEKWKSDANVSCTYLSLIAGLGRGVDGNASPLENVKKIADDQSDQSVYSKTVPNKFYALIGGFARGNTCGFHDLSGSGYDFVVEKLLEMDAINAIAASRLAKPFTEWRLFDPKRKSLMKQSLEKILAAQPSPNMFEICSKSLKEDKGWEVGVCS